VGAPSASCRPIAVAVVALIVAGSVPAVAQIGFARGQNIAPAYEGWEKNEDGSFNLVFGYMNRNWEETIDVPIGPDNQIEPGGPDQGQPTHFLPRRNRFLFRVRVPADFGNQELVWTLKTAGTIEKAYGSLRPDYFIDDFVVQANFGAGGAAGTAPDLPGNQHPGLEIEGDHIRKATVGRPMPLAVVATDDGKPSRRPLAPDSPRFQTRFTTDSATGLRVSWFVYRGEGEVVFDPPQIKVWEDTRGGQNSPWSPGWSTPDVPAGNRWQTTATFAEPGTYVLRCLAHDGGLATAKDVTVVVGE